MSAAPPLERPLLGVALRCLAASAFAGMAALLKIASDHGASITDLVFYRSAGALPVVALWALINGGRAAIRARRPLAHLSRCVMGGISMVFTLGALALLPIAIATTLTYSAPIISTILSGLFLGERIGTRRWGAVLIGFGGVMLLARPGGGGISMFGLAMGLCAAIGQAGVAITLRQISRTESSSAIAFWFTVFTTVCSAVALPWFGLPHGPGAIAILLGAGVFAGIAQLASTASLRFAPVSTVIPFDYIQILWATLIGWLVFASPPTLAMLAGAALITASGLYTAHRERMRGKVPLEAEMIPEA